MQTCVSFVNHEGNTSNDRYKPKHWSKLCVNEFGPNNSEMNCPDLLYITFLLKSQEINAMKAQTEPQIFLQTYLTNKATVYLGYLLSTNESSGVLAHVCLLVFNVSKISHEPEVGFNGRYHGI